MPQGQDVDTGVTTRYFSHRLLSLDTFLKIKTVWNLKIVDGKGAKGTNNIKNTIWSKHVEGFVCFWAITQCQTERAIQEGFLGWTG